MQLYGEKGGALSGGPASPDLKRHSFIIANLQNINTRASTQALSQDQEVTLPRMAEVRDCTKAEAMFVCFDCIITNHFWNCCIFQNCFCFCFFVCVLVCSHACAFIYLRRVCVCTPDSEICDLPYKAIMVQRQPTITYFFHNNHVHRNHMRLKWNKLV